ncbi:protein of unknown function [Nitrospira defluvii]|uniref:Uncharacterized protein n=1 Tax=Nitrospira defluvii TaxID=330214 RepID=D8PDN0_9BACT|nr:protein of unknown function [Nitrospira defluvii]
MSTRLCVCGWCRSGRGRGLKTCSPGTVRGGAMMDTMIGTAANAVGQVRRLAAPARSTADRGIAAVMADGAEMIRGGFGPEM